MAERTQKSLAERIAEQQAKVDAKQKSYNDAKAKLEKLQAEETKSMLSEIEKLAKAKKMTTNEYLKTLIK